MWHLLSPDDLRRGAAVTAMLLWALLLLSGLLLWRLSAGRRRLRPSPSRLTPVRFGWGVSLVGSAAVALVLASLTATGALVGLERPPREMLARVRPPTAPQVLPEVAVIDFRCRSVPLELALWFANRARESGAVGVLIAPPSPEADPVGDLPECRLPHTAAEQVPPVETGLEMLLAGAYPAVVAYASEDAEVARRLQQLRGPRLGHLRIDDPTVEYRLLSATVAADGRRELGAVVLLASELAHIPPELVRTQRKDRLRLGNAEIPLLSDGSFVVGRTSHPLASTELVVRDPYAFWELGRHSPRVSFDTTWEQFCRGRVVLMGVYGQEYDRVSRLSVAYWGANTLFCRVLVQQGRPVPGLYLPHPLGHAPAALLVALSVLVAGSVGYVFRPLPAAALLVGIGAGLAATNLWTALAWQVVLPVGQMALAVLTGGVLALQLSHTFVEAKRSEVERNLGRYVSPQVAAEVLKEGTPTLGGHRRRVTVMFVDIRGFGLLAEAREPAAVVGLINAYFAVIVSVVFKHGGTLDKFIGDAVMAVWGAPVEHPDDALSAVYAAIEIGARTDVLTAERRTRGLLTASLAVGVATGDAIAGNVGDVRRMEYTVIGDAVNVAARLQQLASENGAEVLIAEATAEALAGAVPTVPMGEVTVKHRAEPVGVYAVGADRPRPD